MRRTVAAGGVMKKTIVSALSLLSVAAALSAPVPASAKTDVSVNVNLGPPPVVVTTPAPPPPRGEYPPPRIVVQEPPELVVMPRSMIYFAPGLSVDLFFSNGWWWTRDNDRWYRSREYRGPWGFVPAPRVPREFHEIRPDYRAHYGRERHIPYGQLKKHWREREIERRERRGEWREERREHRRDWKEEKRERKHEMKEEKRERKHEMKEDRREDRHEDRGRGRGRD
jgi:hypothetical protein